MDGPNFYFKLSKEITFPPKFKIHCNKLWLVHTDGNIYWQNKMEEWLILSIKEGWGVIFLNHKKRTIRNELWDLNAEHAFVIQSYLNALNGHNHWYSNGYNCYFLTTETELVFTQIGYCIPPMIWKHYIYNIH